MSKEESGQYGADTWLHTEQRVQARPGTAVNGSTHLLDHDERALLLAMDRLSEPLGVLRAQEELRSFDIDISESTVARRLRSLDGAGLAVQIGKRGRVLTSLGKKYVSNIMVARQSEDLLRAATRIDTSEALLNLLRARRAIEPEAAREAAVRAASADLTDFRSLLGQHSEWLLEKDDIPREAALTFHRRIAALSENPLLQVVLNIALHPSLDKVEATLDIVLRSHHVHEVSIHDHSQILGAIELGDGPLAEKLMRDHLETMIAEVESFAVNDNLDLLNRLLSWTK